MVHFYLDVIPFEHLSEYEPTPRKATYTHELVNDAFRTVTVDNPTCVSLEESQSVQPRYYGEGTGSRMC